MIDRYCQNKFPDLHQQVAEAVNAKTEEDAEMGPLYASILFLIARIERAVEVCGSQMREIKELKRKLAEAG